MEMGVIVALLRRLCLFFFWGVYCGVWGVISVCYRFWGKIFFVAGDRCSSIAPRVRTLTRGVARGSIVSASLCDGCGMGENLHSLSNGNILANLASVSAVARGGLISKGLIPYRNRLHCENCGMGSVISNVLRSSHFNFRRIACLLLFNSVPGRRRLGSFGGLLIRCEALPRRFIHSIVLGTADGSVVGSVTEDILALFYCSGGTGSASVSGILERYVRLVSMFPLLSICNCRTCGRCRHSGDLCVRHTRPAVSATRIVLSLLHPSERCAPLRTGILSVTLVLRVRRNNNGGSAFAARIMASSNASACSTMTTTLTSLGNPGRNNTGIGICCVFRSLGGRIGS